MGAWGYYDDENDTSCDTWYEFLDVIDSRRENSESAKDVVLFEYQTDPIKFWEHVKTFIDHDNSVYICWHLVKAIANVKSQHQPLFGIPPESELPLSLPKDFPESVRILVIDKIEADLKSDLSSWSDPMSRQKALNHELYVFSKGTKGSNGSGKVIQNSFQKFFASKTSD